MVTTKRPEGLADLDVTGIVVGTVPSHRGVKTPEKREARRGIEAVPRR